MSRSRMAVRRSNRAARGSRLRRKRFVLAVLAVAVLAIGVSSWLVFFQSDAAGPPRAVIIDQLSLTFPNPDFREEATAKLERAGYEVDYVPGEDVTVDYYRDLPTFNYEVIVFRSHAARLEAVWQGREIDEVILFTNEPIDEQKYLEDMVNKRLTAAWYREGSEQYFGISPDFVVDSMRGKFDGAMIIMMGCEGLISERTAEAFVQKGASTFISWDETVSAAHTDAATERLLDNLLFEGLSPEEAVAQTMAEVGPDPTYGSKLLAYPSEG